MNVTTEQLAQLLLGVARAQQAIIDALENAKAGFKSTHFRPAIESASRLRSNRTETLADFPSRLLLHMMSRTAPDTDSVIRDLERLLVPPAAAAPAAAAPAAPAAPVAASPPGDDSLDMTK